MADGNFDNVTIANNLGIGTETPNAQLHIDADVSEGKVLVESSSNLFKLSIDGIGATIGTVNAVPFALQTDGSSRLTINPLGDVGIDKANPNFRLDVNGIVNATGYNKGGVPWKLQTADIEDNAVTSAKIADLSITTNELANAAVIEAKLAANAVTTTKIADSAIITTKLAAAVITADKLADNCVSASKIPDGSITAAKLAVGTLPSSQWSNGAAGNLFYNGGKVGIGTNNPQALLHLTSGVTTLRLQSSAGFSPAKVEFWSDPQGSTSEWRPSFIQSIDQGNFTGGLAFFVNGSGATQRTSTIEVMRIANSKVAIGFTEPRTQLHVLGRIATGLDFNSAGSITFYPPDGFAWFHIDNGPANGRAIGRLRISHGGNPGDQEIVSILQNMHVGIGTSAPSQRLEVAGNVRANDYLRASSRALKDDITELSHQEAIQVLAELNPVKFRYKNDPNQETHLGFIAEEVPELLASHDGKSFSTTDLAALLTKVVQAQQILITQLAEKVNQKLGSK